MRRVLALMSAVVLVLAISLPAAAAEPRGAEVVHATYGCNVGWDDSWSAEDSSCDVQNVRIPNGVFAEVLHGQIPADQMAAFRCGVTVLLRDTLPGELRMAGDVPRWRRMGTPHGLHAVGAPLHA